MLRSSFEVAVRKIIHIRQQHPDENLVTTPCYIFLKLLDQHRGYSCADDLRLQIFRPGYKLPVGGKRAYEPH